MKDIASDPQTLSEIKEKHFRATSLAAVSRRLSKLVKSICLRRTLINGRLHFGIGEVGAQYLCERLGYEKENIKIEKGKGFLIERKKPLKNKWVCVTPRDLKTFERLSNGPATFLTLKKNFASSDAFIRRRLQKLSDCGYIKKVKYPSNPSLFFYIAERGAEEIMNKLGYDQDRIRMNIVRAEEVEHELMVTEIIRIIREEESSNKYEVLNLLDDINIRKSFDFKQGVSIPDVSLAIETNDGKYFSFSIEVDSGKRSTKAIIEKIKWYGGIIIIITTTHPRKKALQKAISRDRSVLSRPLIGLLSEVARERSLISRNWWNEDDSNRNLT